jgi:hypothetical protein
MIIAKKTNSPKTANAINNCANELINHIICKYPTSIDIIPPIMTPALIMPEKRKKPIKIVIIPTPTSPKDLIFLL